MKRNARSLEKIAGEIHSLERQNVFEIGKLLIEAKESAEHGAWLEWFDDSAFDFSEDTAERYMRLARLAANSADVRNLNIPLTAFYELSAQADENLPEIIKTLKAAGPLSVSDARAIIQEVALRDVYGDYPAATLLELDSIRENEPWAGAAAKALKKRKPTNTDDARNILTECHRKHVAALYTEHGKLPENVSYYGLKALEDDVPDDLRADVLKNLSQIDHTIDIDDVRLAVVKANYSAEADESPPTAPDDDKLELTDIDPSAESSCDYDWDNVKPEDFGDADIAYKRQAMFYASESLRHAETNPISKVSPSKVTREEIETIRNVGNTWIALADRLAADERASRGNRSAKAIADRAEARSKIKLVQ